MKNKRIRYLLLSLLLATSCSAFADSFVEKHGALNVVKGKITDQHGEPFAYACPSLFWSNNGWEGEAFYNASVVSHLAKEWNAPVIRAAIGVDGHGGYIEAPEDNLKKAETVINAAIENGIYVIVDFHSHYAENHLDEAISFFTYLAKKYGKHPNVLYEIYNEPLNNTDWKTVIKPYSEAVIAAIRNVDKDNLILVGSQSWSQDVDVSAGNPITGFSNLAYTLHFYAGTHKQGLRDKAQVALDKELALYVTEWGTVNANGDGELDRVSTGEWLSFMKENQLPHCSWSIVNKKEGSAILKPSASPSGDWKDEALTENGKYLKSMMKKWNMK